VETGRPCTRCQKCTRVHGPSTRAVNSGSGNRPLVRPIDVTFGIGCRLIWNWCIRELPPNRIINFLFTARQAVMWTLTIFNISLIWRIDSRVRRARCERDLRLGAIVEPVAIAVCESNGVKTMTTHTHTRTNLTCGEGALPSFHLNQEGWPSSLNAHPLDLCFLLWNTNIFHLLFNNIPPCPSFLDRRGLCTVQRRQVEGKY